MKGAGFELGRESSDFRKLGLFIWGKAALTAPKLLAESCPGKDLLPLRHSFSWSDPSPPLLGVQSPLSSDARSGPAVPPLDGW